MLRASTCVSSLLYSGSPSAKCQGLHFVCPVRASAGLTGTPLICGYAPDWRGGGRWGAASGGKCELGPRESLHGACVEEAELRLGLKFRGETPPPPSRHPWEARLVAAWIGGHQRQKDTHTYPHSPPNSWPWGGGGGSSPLPSRDQALPFGPQEAIVLQPHTSPRYGVSSHTRTFTNLTLPSLTFPNSTALLWTLTCIPLFPFCWV